MNSLHKKIVFIDDDPINNIIVSEAVKKTDVVESYRFFTNGWEAIKYLKELDSNTFPDIIFVDLKMPEMDGFEFIEQYQKELWLTFPATKIYIVTSSVSSRDRTRAEGFQSVSDFIIKPLNKAVLLSVL